MNTLTYPELKMLVSAIAIRNNSFASRIRLQTALLATIELHVIRFLWNQSNANKTDVDAIHKKRVYNN